MKKSKINLDSDFSSFMRKLGPKAANTCLLTGSEEGWGELLAWNPCDSYETGVSEFSGDNLLRFIDKHQAQNHLIVGFLNYNLGHSLHDIAPSKKKSLNLPGVSLHAYDNYLKQEQGSTYAIHKSNNFLGLIDQLNETTPPRKDMADLKFEPEWSYKDYHEAFIKIKKYIYDGLIYQINLTHRLKANYNGSPRDLFNFLARKNTAKMMAYFEGSDFEIISMSPERFIRTKQGLIETEPIKGTISRGKNTEEDKLNRNKLLNNEKEKAELNMITDLLRNDLGKVCRPGSVEVAARRKIEKLTSVIHTFSTIRGGLKEEIRPIQALLSMFPGGSVTGCPKRKAMELIDELESSSRGAYCGSVFMIDEKGDLDSNILIRTVVKKAEFLNLSVGGGIVYDSIEKKEFKESLDKAKSIAG